MIGLIALVLPLTLGTILAFPVGYRTQRAARNLRETGGSWVLFFIKYFGGTALLVLAVSTVLAANFASALDTQDGHATASEFVNYVKFQAFAMSVMILPTLIMAFLLGQQKKG